MHSGTDEVLRDVVLERIRAVTEIIRSDVEGFHEDWLHCRREKQGIKRIQRVRIIFNFLDELDMPEIGEPVVTETTMDAERRRDTRPRRPMRQ